MPIFLTLHKTRNMDNKDTKLKQLRENLISGSDSKLINEIRRLRDSKAIPGAILLLRELYEETSNNEVKEVIVEFLNDLKDQNLTDEVISAIDSAKSELTRQVIISSCWQSGLDYSSHLQRFIEYAIELNYLATLECYSVIEEWTGQSNNDDLGLWIKMINDSMDDQIEEKKALLKAILSILQ